MQDILMLSTQGMLMNEEERGDLSKQARMDFSHSTTRNYTAKAEIFASEGRQHNTLLFSLNEVVKIHEQFLEKSPTSSFTS